MLLYVFSGFAQVMSAISTSFPSILSVTVAFARGSNVFPSRIEPWIIGKLKTGFSLASTMHSVLAEEWNGLFVELIILIPSIPRASISAFI